MTCNTFGQWEIYQGESCSPQVCVDASQTTGPLTAACTSECTSGATQCYSPYGVETCADGVWGGGSDYGCGAVPDYSGAFSCWNGACVECNATYLSTLRPNLEQCNLASATLDGLYMGNWDLAQAQLDGASLIGANLTGTDLEYANLTGANLTNANLTNAYLDAATMTNAVLTGVIWSNTTCPDETNSDSNGGTCVGH